MNESRKFPPHAERILRHFTGEKRDKMEAKLLEIAEIEARLERRREANIIRSVQMKLYGTLREGQDEPI